jgi:hypothetical protein
MTQAVIRFQVYQVSQSFFLFLLGILGVSTQQAAAMVHGPIFFYKWYLALNKSKTLQSFSL